MSGPPATGLKDIFHAFKTQESELLKHDRTQLWRRRYYDLNGFELASV